MQASLQTIVSKWLSFLWDLLIMTERLPLLDLVIEERKESR